ncbi:LuxR C-terminal-related transcriptional regulator [Roseovarius dicentrarchi]|uniref:LuxR C-terminal-related transcriptional regulator n=1 Tax=Roseovarius dicentrarchi TaxID=2250573 RepID=UPI000DE84BE5|nr:response regulator transcription factor [Roseovarius dicentrarchi]
MTARVLIVEDIRASRLFLADRVRAVFPGAEICEACDVRSALEACGRYQFSIALVDIGLPDGDGYDVLRKLAQCQTSVLPIVTTVMGSDSAIVAALSAGAQGYILKSDPPGLIERHLQLIGDGVPPLSPAIARRVMAHFRATGPIAEDGGALTPREAEVLGLIARGLRVADVALALDLAPSTVASHIKAIYRKLNISSRAEATYQAARMGLIAGKD